MTYRNLNQNTKIFIKKKTFENVVWKVAVILSQLQCGKKSISKKDDTDLDLEGDSFPDSLRFIPLPADFTVLQR